MKEYQVIFRKISNNHQRLRDDLIHGVTIELPQEGKYFLLTAPPRDGGSFRQVNTSLIKKVTKTENTYRFETESGSTYEVEVVRELSLRN